MSADTLREQLEKEAWRFFVENNSVGPEDFETFALEAARMALQEAESLLRRCGRGSADVVSTMLREFDASDAPKVKAHRRPAVGDLVEFAYHGRLKGKVDYLEEGGVAHVKVEGHVLLAHNDWTRLAPDAEKNAEEPDKPEHVVELSREVDGRWIASFPGVDCYGDTKSAALRRLADILDDLDKETAEPDLAAQVKALTERVAALEETSRRHSAFERTSDENVSAAYKLATKALRIIDEHEGRIDDLAKAEQAREKPATSWEPPEAGRQVLALIQGLRAFGTVEPAYAGFYVARPGGAGRYCPNGTPWEYV